MGQNRVIEITVLQGGGVTITAQLYDQNNALPVISFTGENRATLVRCYFPSEWKGLTKNVHIKQAKKYVQSGSGTKEDIYEFYIESSATQISGSVVLQLTAQGEGEIPQTYFSEQIEGVILPALNAEDNPLMYANQEPYAITLVHDAIEEVQNAKNNVDIAAAAANAAAANANAIADSKLNKSGGEGKDVVVSFTLAETDQNITSGSPLGKLFRIIFNRIAEFISFKSGTVQALSDESSSRTSADQQLNNRIDTEISNRTGADALKADIVDGKVPLNQLPDNVVYSGATPKVPVTAIPSIGEDKITINFTGNHNLSAGQIIAFEANEGGSLPLGVDYNEFPTNVSKQIKERRIFLVKEIVSPTSIRVVNFSSSATSIPTTAPIVLDSAVVQASSEYLISSTFYQHFAIGSDGTYYIAYASMSAQATLYVKKYVNGVWQQLGVNGLNAAFELATSNDFCFKLSANNVPYILFKGYTTNKLNIAKYEAGAWSLVGAKQPETSYQGNHYDLYLVGEMPYIAFTDTNTYKAQVARYNGSAWEFVGTNPISSATAQYCNLAYDGTNLYLGYYDLSIGGKATVMKYNGTSWSVAGSAGYSPNSISGIKLYNHNGVLYSCFAGSNGYLYIYACENNVWTSKLTYSAQTIQNLFSYVISSNGIHYMTVYNSTNGYRQLMRGIESSGMVSYSLCSSSITPKVTIYQDEIYVATFNQNAYKCYIAKLSYNAGSNWRVITYPNSIAVNNLDFNADGGCYEIFIHGVLTKFPITMSGICGYFTVNGLSTNIYSSGLSSITYGIQEPIPQFAFTLLQSGLDEITSRIILKRVSSECIAVFVQGIAAFNTGSPSCSLFTPCGIIKGPGIENITSIELVLSNCPIMDDSKIIIRRVVNDATSIGGI